MAKTLQATAKTKAKAGTQGVAKVAVEALGAAAVAAAGVVLTRTAEALGSGAKKAQQAKPEAEAAVLRAVAPSRSKKAASTKKAARKAVRKKSARKRVKTTRQRKKARR